ncbi:MAG: type VI-A CRISPR-associated RNA-guided ribonuclease Cas13a [Lachnospiraceae bacterium]|nr:type VI-A CRISPR-associated RNA-guided ribonuclease Cas13a [Lachnospiraceae bacterium]
MKVTKVDGIRFGVSRRERGEGDRGILYQSPKLKDGRQTLEVRFQARVREANKRYSVFFRADNMDSLERIFSEVVSKVWKQTEEQKEEKTDVREVLKSCISPQKYRPEDTKRLDAILRLHVQARMTDAWQEEKNRRIAVKILKLFCQTGSAVSPEKALAAIPKEELEVFWQVCRKTRGESPYVPKSVLSSNDERGTILIEEVFSVLLKTLLDYSSSNESENDGEIASDPVERQIAWLLSDEPRVLSFKSWDRKTKQTKEKKVSLEEIRWSFATEERLSALLVRMRQSLKRGSNRRVAIRLMQGLAQQDNQNLKLVVEEMKEDSQSYEELKRFFGAAYRNYYKTDVLQSIRKKNMKVQIYQKENGLGQLELSSIRKPEKAALTGTLERYASSEKSSAEEMRQLKSLLFGYFYPDAKREIYLWDDDDKDWKEKLFHFPNVKEVYFDSDFLQEEPAGERDPGEALEVLWHESTRMELDYIANPKVQKAEERRRFNAVKNRIKYVNYGKYLQGLRRESDEFKRYWLRFVKEFVEKNYTGSVKITREDCYATKMMVSCWGEIIRFLCGKYIDIGKAVYHFTIPAESAETGEIQCGNVLEPYRKGISSFDYEAIQAEDTLKRDIAVISVSANRTFSMSVIDEEKREQRRKTERKHQDDILMVHKPAELEPLLKEDAQKLLLRFYGGNSTISAPVCSRNDLPLFVLELSSHLYAIRNENFHYVQGKKKELEVSYTRKLWENDREAYAAVTRQRYYANNTGKFYQEEDIQGMVRKLYAKQPGNESASAEQVPAFRNVWKRQALTDDINTYLNRKKQKQEKQIPPFLDGAGEKEKTEKRVMYEGALYFLLKEVYYRDFIRSREAKAYFLRAEDEHKKAASAEARKKGLNYRKRDDAKKKEKAAENFHAFIQTVTKSDPNLSFAGICQAVTQEFTMQNARHPETEIYQHFKMLLPICIKRALQKYLKDNYGFLLTPVDRSSECSGEAHYLDGEKPDCMEFPEGNQTLAAWFTFAHFIHPRQLNLLVGDLKNYLQYREGILKRERLADEQRGGKAEALGRDRKQAGAILKVLEFVRVLSGRVSAQFEDYYGDKEEFAEYLSHYIAFPVEKDDRKFESLKRFYASVFPEEAEGCTNSVSGIYTDAKNPRLLRNIEIARMYTGGDHPFLGECGIRQPLTEEEFRDYSRKETILKDKALFAADPDAARENKSMVVDQQHRKNRITLNDVTDLYAILNDLLGQLATFAYLRERDKMYLLLGFYYMALRSPQDGQQGWEKEELQSARFERGSVRTGLVLYQISSVFEYGKKLPMLEKGNWVFGRGSETIEMKYKNFSGIHKESMNCAMLLFEKPRKHDVIQKLRNYVDHGMYYMDHKKSIVDLYSEFYRDFFWYSRKLRKNVLDSFKAILERYFIEAPGLQLLRDNNGFQVVSESDKKQPLQSVQFTYKLGDGVLKKEARDETFIGEVFRALIYKASEKGKKDEKATFASQKNGTRMKNS